MVSITHDRLGKIHIHNGLEEIACVDAEGELAPHLKTLGIPPHATVSVQLANGRVWQVAASTYMETVAWQS
jgi:hypothetical protein